MKKILSGKVALVTGGRGGIGRAICGRFQREGAKVFAADITDGGSLSGTGDDGAFVKFDVTSEDDAKAVMERVASEAGKLDILVNAAVHFCLRPRFCLARIEIRSGLIRVDAWLGPIAALVEIRTAAKQRQGHDEKS